jgi:hypothetical protein
MIRIASAPVTDKFAIDAGPTTTGMLELFEDERTPPSAMTKPSRSRSKGRLASWGAVMLEDSARILPKVLTASGVMTASVPPASMTSAAPRTIV